MTNPEGVLPLGEQAEISIQSVLEVRDAILSTIADRGADRSKKLLSVLVKAYVEGRETPLTWRELWAECWDEPLTSLRSADTVPSRTVGQAIYRLREILQRYFESDRGSLHPFFFVIEQNQLRVLHRDLTLDEGDGAPFLDSAFPE